MNMRGLTMKVWKVVLVCFLLCGFMSLGAWAPAPMGDADRKAVLEVAARAYATSWKRLTVNQQMEMTMIKGVIDAKTGDAPEAFISMGYMSMVTQGAIRDASTVLAAWGVQQVPTSPTLLNNLGYALFLLKNYPDSITVLKQAIALDSGHAQYLNNLANDYLDMGDNDLAKATYERALKVDPKSTVAWSGLFHYYMKTRQIKAAMEIAIKLHGIGFQQEGANKMQKDIDAEDPADKCDWVLEGDSLDAAAGKVKKIADSKPLSLVPIIAPIAPELARQVAAASESVTIQVQAPAKPWVIDYSSAENYYVTSRAYQDVNPLPLETPALTPAQQRLASKSKAELKEIGQQYKQNALALKEQLQGIKPGDTAQLQQALKAIKAMPDPYGLLPSAPDKAGSPPAAAGAQNPAPAIPSGGASGAAFPSRDKAGMVTTSNFDNYARNKINFARHCKKLIKNLEDYSKDLGDQFNGEMQALRARQGNGAGPEMIKQRNALREAYAKRFGDYQTAFYNHYVRPAAEDIDRSSALFIRNMHDPDLRHGEAQAVRNQVRSLLAAFHHAKAPIDDPEPESPEVGKKWEAQVALAKASATKHGEVAPTYQAYDKQEKSLLEWAVEDSKYRAMAGLVALKWENAELSLEMNDPTSNQYMTLGVSIKGGDLAITHTDGRGSDFGFTVESEGIKAKVDLSNTEPGTKTSLFLTMDDDFNVSVADAQITSTPGTKGFTTSVGANGFQVKGSAAVVSTAEGTSEFESEFEASYKEQVLKLIPIFKNSYKFKAPLSE
jgi:tetratricopeptide (TPR) repeat protein